MAEKVKFSAKVKVSPDLVVSLRAVNEFKEYLWKYLSCDCALGVENPRCDGQGKHIAGPFLDPMTSYDRQQS